MQPYQPQQPSYGNAFPPAGPTAPPKKKTNWALIGGVGCLGVLVVCCVFPVGGFFIGNSSAKGDAEDTVSEIAEIGRQRDANRLYSMLDSYSRTSVDVAQMPEAIGRCVGLSTNTSVTVEDFEIDHPFDDFVLVRVRYETPTGSIPASIGLERESDGYRLATYHEDVPGQRYGACDPTRTPYTPPTYGY